MPFSRLSAAAARASRSTTAKAGRAAVQEALTSRSAVAEQISEHRHKE
ncbi:hypothetical protein [Streptomyces sp. NPDC088766]